MGVVLAALLSCSGCEYGRSAAKTAIAGRDRLFTFLENEGVEPTNNSVERALRTGVQWRKICFGNRSASGELATSRLLTVAETCDFAPRFGFAWSPKGTSPSARPSIVIRGGFGVFYDRFNEQNVLFAQRYNGVTQQSYVIADPDTFPVVPSLASLDEFAGSQAIHTIARNLQAPYDMQSAIGIERQLPGNTTLTVKYTNTHGLHELLTRDINAPLPGTYTGVPGSGVYPYGNVGPIDQMESAGLYNQNQLVTNVNTRMNPYVSLFGYYVLSYARSNTDGIGTYPANQYDLRADYGPASNDVRNRVVLGGSLGTKWGVRLNPFIIAQTGAPFNITTSQDVYGDTILTARPGIATNPNAPGVIATPYGLLDPNPTPGEQIVPRNFGRSPGLVAVNLRLSKTFGFGPERPVSNPSPGALASHRYNLTFSISARNALNHVNPGPIIGNINSPLFGESNQIAGGYGAYAGAANNRRIELQARFSF
jgi:hypothetical protein